MTCPAHLTRRSESTRSWTPCSGTRSAPPRGWGSSCSRRRESHGRDRSSIRIGSAPRWRSSGEIVRRGGSVSTAHNRVAVMHGVNFDILERRDAAIYGGLSLDELERRIGGFARELGLEATFFQTNSEGEFVEHLHRLPDLADAVVINAGAWTHYSRAIADALDVTRLPAVEVHLSDVESRDDWRRISVFDGLVLAKVSGKGADGYREALAAIAGELGVGR